MKKHSTGKLSQETLELQNKRYAEKHTYDYLIIGTGSAALTVGSLLAHSGKKICMLESHDIPGGYLQSFKMGDYHFCAQVHYIWGCGPGGKINSFLKKIGLDKDITFELYNPEGYDHMIMPDGKRVKIPYGFDNLEKSIDHAYPGQGEKVRKFCNILKKIRKEMSLFPQRKLKLSDYLITGPKVLTLIKYRNKTLQDVFDECGLSKEAQAVLIANAGDMMLPPKELSIFAYTGLFGGYNTGAYYPTKHFKYYVDRIVQKIESHEGCHIYYEMPVTKFNVENDKISSVETKDGKVFTADTIICNMDPQTAAKMIGLERFPKSEQELLSYEYSPSGIVIYLGLKDIDLKKYGFGKHNTWHLDQWDMNQLWKDHASGNFEKPWIFMSTPTLHSEEPGVAPKGGHILEICTHTDYESFKEAQDRDYREYHKMKHALANRLLDFVEEKHIPNLRKHIAVKVVATSVTNEDFVHAPKGNSYGSSMTPAQITTKRLKATTPFSNLYWCNASSGYAGVYGTVGTGMQLYMDLTGDEFYKASEAPSDEQLIAQLKNQ